MPFASTETDLLREILSVSRLLVVTTDLDALLQRIAEAGCKMIGCERATIFLHDSKTNELWSRIAIGSDEIRFPATSGIAGYVFSSNKMLHVSDPYSDPRFNAGPDRASGFVTRNLLTIPLVDLDRKPLGVLQAVNTLDDDFSEVDKRMIQLLADQAGVAIQRYHLQRAAMEWAELKREVELTRDVQVAMLPKHPLHMPGIECLGWTRPAGLTGGDLYDLWKMPDQSLGLFLGDAMGHGLAPTLMVSQVRTVLRSLCQFESCPVKLLRMLNQRFAEDFASGKFATAFVGVVSSNGLLTWSSAGHGPSLFKADPEGPVETMAANGIPLGILPHDYTAISVSPVQLKPGGWIAVVSDGIYEAPNPAGEHFGVERTTALIESLRQQSVADTLKQLQTAIDEWQQSDVIQDDQTIVIVRRQG